MQGYMTTLPYRHPCSHLRHEFQADISGMTAFNIGAVKQPQVLHWTAGVS